jgi:ATP-dependent DNA helicase RecG
MALETLLAAGESESLEFKSSLSDTRRLVETIAALSTAGGGTILVGVRDDGTPVGANVGEGEVERLVQQVLANTDPRIYVRVTQPSVDGRLILRIEVPPGDGPHLAFGRAFHRVGPATVQMSRDEYERRLLDRLRESAGFERRVDPSISRADVDPAAVARFLDRARATGRVPPGGDDVLAALHVGWGDRLTVAALLLFGRWPQGALPQATIRALARRGGTEDAATIEGTLDEQIERAVLFVGRNLRVRVSRTGVRRAEIPEIPLTAVREVVANAVAHRDYRSTAPTQLRLGDDGLFVWNPGHLPPPLSVASLRREHPSVPPNPLIARALYLAGYIEEWGTGTLRIIAEMARAGNPEAVFEADDAGISVRLPMPGARPALPGRLADAMRALPRGTAFKSSEYAGQLNVSIRTAAADLAELERLGFVQREGTGRATRWRLVQE